MAAQGSASDTFQSAPGFANVEKTEGIGCILAVLEADLGDMDSLPSKHGEIIERLRVHSATPGSLGPLATKRGIALCCRYGFDNTSLTTSRIALRCLCNTLLLAKPTRQMFVDEDYPRKAVERMKNGEFLSARLLLLCTYGTNLNFNVLFEKYDLAEIINSNITRHAKLIEDTPRPIPTATISSCSESLKLLYLLKAHYPHRAVQFSESLGPILSMLSKVPILSPPLQPPVSFLINSLVDPNFVDNDGNTTEQHLFPSHDANVDVDRLVRILHLATEAYSDEEMEQHGSSLVQVLLQISKFAPPRLKARLQALLLPSDRDRADALGAGDSLPARLLRLSTAPTANNLRGLIPALLFELSDRDVQQFVHNIGYGFAAGFLLSEGIEIPANALESWSTGDVNDSNSNPGDGNGGFIINPITGQRRDMEPTVPIPEMTDDEKEREAERLFVLFERLRSTGVVDVENPVAQAMREGRFEEVD